MSIQLVFDISTEDMREGDRVGDRINQAIEDLVKQLTFRIENQGFKPGTELKDYQLDGLDFRWQESKNWLTQEDFNETIEK